MNKFSATCDPYIKEMAGILAAGGTVISKPGQCPTGTKQNDIPPVNGSIMCDPINAPNDLRERFMKNQIELEKCAKAAQTPAATSTYAPEPYGGKMW